LDLCFDSPIFVFLFHCSPPVKERNNYFNGKKIAAAATSALTTPSRAEPSTFQEEARP
jgi:hypothetical protein